MNKIEIKDLYLVFGPEKHESCEESSLDYKKL